MSAWTNIIGQGHCGPKTHALLCIYHVVMPRHVSLRMSLILERESI